MGLAPLYIGPATLLVDIDVPDTRGETAMLSVFAGVGALYLGLAVVRMFTAEAGRMWLRRVRDPGIGLFLAGAPLAVLAGWSSWEAIAAAWILPVLAFLFDRRFFLPTLRKTGAEKESLLKTRFLDVTLDPVADVLDGVVIEGQFRGRILSDLSPDELDALMVEVSADPDSVAVLTGIFMQFREAGRGGAGDTEAGAGRGRQRRAGARGRRGGGDRRGGTAMEAEEAYRVLGLEPGASAKEILATHRRLMKMVHPDAGGSDYLASKVNEARDLLLGL